MFVSAGEQVGARLLQQRCASPFSRAHLPSSATPSSAMSRRAFSPDSSKDPEGEHILEEAKGPSIWKEKHVDKTLLRFLIGKGGSARAKLEEETGARLYIPSTREAQSRSSVRINGSEPAVNAASAAIQKILDDAIKSKLEYSHFISIPLAMHPALVEKITQFQQSILSSSQKSQVSTESSPTDDEDLSSSGVDESIFVKPATFHLTILMLKLWNEERVEAASNLLHAVIPRVHAAVESEPVTVDLRGLECLRGTPERAHVLYATIEARSQSRLIKVCQILRGAFIESGLVLDRDVGQELKLHATLMNTTSRKRENRKLSSKPVPFDARKILAKYKDWNWGEYTLLETHLSQRFVYNENGYYHCVRAIPLPQHST